MNQAELGRLVSRLRISVQPKHRKMGSTEGPAGRLNRLRATVTALVKYERIELNYHRADEARGYAERLISDAIRYGDTHKHTMEMADWWLEEKQLVHKLFKVLVPRFKDYPTAYTRIFNAPNEYPGSIRRGGISVLELKGNPFPALQPAETRSHPFWLHNVLLDEARRDFREEKEASLEQSATSAPTSEANTSNN